MTHTDEKPQPQPPTPPTTPPPATQNPLADMTTIDPGKLAATIAISAYILLSSFAYAAIGEAKEMLPFFWSIAIPFTLMMLSSGVIFAFSQTKGLAFQTRCLAVAIIPILYVLGCLACYTVTEDKIYLLICCFMIAPAGTGAIVFGSAVVVAVADNQGLV